MFAHAAVSETTGCVTPPATTPVFYLYACPSISKLRLEINVANPHGDNELCDRRAITGNVTLWLNNFGLYDRKSTESSNLVLLPPSHAAQEPLPSAEMV